MKRVESVLEYAHNSDSLYFHVGKSTIQGGLSCPICMSIFKNPVIVVPCGHSFCNVRPAHEAMFMQVEGTQPGMSHVS